MLYLVGSFRCRWYIQDKMVVAVDVILVLITLSTPHLHLAELKLCQLFYTMAKWRTDKHNNTQSDSFLFFLTLKHF